MSEGAKISKIVIELGRKEIELTTEQAEKLFDALNEMFGKKVVERIVERDRYVPYYPWRWGYGGVTYCANIGDGNNALKATYNSSNETLCLSAK